MRANYRQNSHVNLNFSQTEIDLCFLLQMKNKRKAYGENVHTYNNKHDTWQYLEQLMDTKIEASCCRSTSL